ncbi:MAG: prolipoprotein diacylglyceryl transferase [Candidatus Omnitrophica bacterium]|nr:prolipoprotein diacylglyceryl transferase [Candidatus Omnitrophota bacterium]MBL7151519.1 prolipoprotein diacylglyceryl transferase [Candidatus Omnitrophota bacterium]
MYPVICKIGPFTVYSYGLMLALAVIVASSLAARRARGEGINPDIIFNLCFIAVISGILGARIFYVIENLGYYLDNPAEIIMLQHGGLSWFGGMAFGTILAAVYLKNKKLSFYKILDLLSPFIALGHSIGRVGCLLNGCCFGKPWALGIYFPAEGRTLIPVQIYASLILVLIFLFLRQLQDRPHKDGQIFYAYLLLYSFARFFIEFLRGDHQTLFVGLTLFQFISLAIFCLSVVMLLICRNTRLK